MEKRQKREKYKRTLEACYVVLSGLSNVCKKHRGANDSEGERERERKRDKRQKARELGGKRAADSHTGVNVRTISDEEFVQRLLRVCTSLHPYVIHLATKDAC